jgi:hypothetical protein
MVRGYELTSMLLLARKIKIVGREIYLQVSLKRRRSYLKRQRFRTTWEYSLNVGCTSIVNTEAVGKDYSRKRIHVYMPKQPDFYSYVAWACMSTCEELRMQLRRASLQRVVNLVQFEPVVPTSTGAHPRCALTNPVCRHIAPCLRDSVPRTHRYAAWRRHCAQGATDETMQYAWHCSTWRMARSSRMLLSFASTKSP